MGFSRQEYWSGLPFPPPGDLPDPGLKPCLLHWQVDSLPLSHLGSPKNITHYHLNKSQNNTVESTCVNNEKDTGQISYIYACMWNLEKWYRWTHLQGRNRDTDIDNGCMLGDELGDWDWHKYTAAAAKLLQSCPTLCDHIEGSPPGSPIPGVLLARTL